MVTALKNILDFPVLLTHLKWLELREILFEATDDLTSSDYFGLAIIIIFLFFASRVED